MTFPPNCSNPWPFYDNSGFRLRFRTFQVYSWLWQPCRMSAGCGGQLLSPQTSFRMYFPHAAWCTRFYNNMPISQYHFFSLYRCFSSQIILWCGATRCVLVLYLFPQWWTWTVEWQKAYSIFTVRKLVSYSKDFFCNRSCSRCPCQW